MKFAVLTIAFNEEDYIGAHIKNWAGLIDKHLVLLSSFPYDKKERPRDRTGDIARQLGAQVIERYWITETEQRNFGLAYLYDYDYVFIIDPDEFFLRSDIELMIKHIEAEGKDRWMGHIVKETKQYWKNTDTVAKPQDSNPYKHKNIYGLDPKQTYFGTVRIPYPADEVGPHIRNRGIFPVTCYHLSWVRTRSKIKEKLETFCHAIPDAEQWCKDNWDDWQLGQLINAFHFINARPEHDPLPQEIRQLL